MGKIEIAGMPKMSPNARSGKRKLGKSEEIALAMRKIPAKLRYKAPNYSKVSSHWVSDRSSSSV